MAYSSKEILLSLPLLAFLAVTNEPQTRERLATLLWPEYPRKSSLSYLRQALWHLSQALPSGALVVDHSQIGLQGVTVDVAEFRALAAQPTLSMGFSSDRGKHKT